MDLHKQLQELEKLPVDEGMKRAMYHQIQRPKKNNYIWKELALIVGIVLLAIVLIIPPQSQSTATGTIQEVYKYFGGDEGEFYGRASMLYIGVDRVLNEEVKEFFATIKKEEFTQEGKLGRHIADVVVVQDDGVQHRYQVSEYDMLDVDTGLYYSGESERYSEVFNELYSVDVLPMWPQLIVLIVLIHQAILNRMYKKKGFHRPKYFKGAYVPVGLFVGIFSSSVLWHIYIGPLYQPILLIVCIAWVYIAWRALKPQLPTSLFYTVEKINLLLIILVIIMVIMSF
ncbi:hypothetical protein [Lysinibacillus sp. LZ02]|uniref:hypothetical protein n=1 Tax=Lysinibacillus sp. LZ02 TaxID=3420668 RepID=UPI003D365B77